MVQQHSLQFQVQDALQLKLRKECTVLQETLTELHLQQQQLPTVTTQISKHWLQEDPVIKQQPG